MSKDYYLKALKINEELNFVSELIINNRALGRVYKREGNYQKALEMFNKSLELAKENNIKQEIQYGYEDLSKTYQKLGQYKKAFDYYRLFVLYKDSIFSENSSKRINQLQEQLGAAKTKRALEQQQAASALQEAQIKKQKILIFVAVAILILIAFFMIYIFQQNKKIKKANDQLEEQNELIMDQKKEITDSIHYASRIQRAILPPDELLDRVLPEKFLLFKPRDIVSGDYYYINEKNGKVVVIAADCTGHGVPGAFMSMLGTAFLNQIMGSDDEPHSDIILNQLRGHVIRSLHQTGKTGESADGMDLALYVLDFEKKQIEFSGANNPLVIIRDGEVLETKADKMPIGIHIRKDEPFTRNVVDVKKGDVLYTFSDGYQDQFGGPKGKKFMIKNLKVLLSEIYKKPMEEQKQILNDAIEKWMENTEQIDDIILIGVRIV